MKENINITQFEGISSNFSVNPNNFKEIQIEETLSLSQSKPAVRELSHAEARVTINSREIAMEQDLLSHDGQIVTNISVIVTGYLEMKIEYTSTSDNSQLQSTNFTIPFMNYISLGEEFSSDSEIIITPFLEDAYARLLGERDIFINILFTLIAETNNL